MLVKDTALNEDFKKRLGEDVEITPSGIKEVNGTVYIKIGLAAKLVGKSTQTIKHWYEYAQEKKIDFPTIHTELDNRGTRYFTQEAIYALEKFGKNISYGSMSDFNIKLWGNRGENIQAKNSNRFKADRNENLISMKAD